MALWAAPMENRKPKSLLIIISGPSGSGKKTLLDHIVAQFPDLERIPTYTTRAPRPGEVPGVDYVFVSDKEFAELRESGMIFECTQPYGDFWYGSPSRLIEDGDTRSYLAEMDPSGMLKVRACSQRRVVSIFILPPTEHELASRIKCRGTELNVDTRLSIVIQQAEHAWAYDYVIVNLDLADFLSDGSAIVNAELVRQRGLHRLLTGCSDPSTACSSMETEEQNRCR